MAVLVEFRMPGGTAEQLYAAERAAEVRAEAVGGSPYPGLMFLAVTADDGGARLVSVWRTEPVFREALGTSFGSDLTDSGLSVVDVSVAPVVGMAMPPAGAG